MSFSFNVYLIWNKLFWNFQQIIEFQDLTALSETHKNINFPEHWKPPSPLALGWIHQLTTGSFRVSKPEADPLRIQEFLCNLALNAVKVYRAQISKQDFFNSVKGHFPINSKGIHLFMFVPFDLRHLQTMKKNSSNDQNLLTKQREWHLNNLVYYKMELARYRERHLTLAV